MSTATSAAGDAFRESVRSWVEANFPGNSKINPLPWKAPATVTWPRP